MNADEDDDDDNGSNRSESTAVTLQEVDDRTIVRLSASNIPDFHSLARRLRNLEEKRMDVLSLYRLHLDYNEAHEVMTQLHRFKEVRMNDCQGDSVALVLDEIFHTSTCIQTLELVSTQELGDDILSSVSRGLQRAPHGLKELCLKVTITTNAAQSIFVDGINRPLNVEDLEQVTLLQHLDLSRCEFDTEDTVPILCQGLRENVGLTTLKLDNCQLYGGELADILVALSHHPTVKDISMALNMADLDTVTAAANLLLGQGTTSGAASDDVSGGCLERLNLGQQNPGEFRNANVLYDSLRTNNQLKSLCLCENDLLQSQITVLVHALRENHTLEELDLQHCGLRREGIEQIIDSLSHYPSLRKLWLRNNCTLHSADRTINLSQAVVREMELNHTLQVLDIDEWWVPDKNQLRLMNWYLHLNWAGRRFLKKHPSNPLPLGMWPFVLERVQTAVRPPSRPMTEDPSNTDSEALPRTDVFCVHSTLFFLLKGPALCQR